MRQCAGCWRENMPKVIELGATAGALTRPPVRRSDRAPTILAEVPFALPVALLGIAAAVLCAELLIILPRVAVVALIAVPVWFALPGVLMTHRVLGSQHQNRGSAWLVGPALGFGVGVFGLLLFWAVGIQNWFALLLAPGLTWAVAWLAARLGGIPLRLPTMDRRDLAAVAVVLLVVPLITWAPYDHIREPVADGEAYRAYFTADFIWAMTVASELSKGEVPPPNPFHVVEPMRYYWMAHLLSGAVYRNVQAWGVQVETIVLVNGLAFGLAFAGFLYWLTRSVGATAGWAAVATLIGFLANSFEGADMIRSIVVRDSSWEVLRQTNIDAVTRWFYEGMAVDGLQRLLLYQPHHLTGYVLALSAVWLAGLAEKVDDLAVPLCAGTLLGLAFLFSTFAAILLGGAVGLVFAVRLIQQGTVRSVIHCAILGAGPVIVGIGIAELLGYTNPSDGLLLQVGPNPVAFRNWEWVVFLSFGPLLLIGLAGLLRPRWVSRAGLMPAAVVVTSFLFYFFTDVPDMAGVWVGWRSGHMLLIAFTAITGAALTAVWALRRTRVLVVAGLAVVVAVAVPTVAIDVYNAQDIRNREEGAGFPWTLIITPEEREAFNWIRAHTPPTAVVQPEPVVRAARTWAYVPAFAERRMAAGLPISMIPLRGYELASQDVRYGIFDASTAEDAHAMADFLQVDYLLVGEVEREAYGPQVEEMLGEPALFEVVFENAAIAVIKVRRTGDDAGRR